MRKKVVVLVPVHCAPKVAMMTLGSWLEAADGSYEASIILGVHENYHHYHDGLPSLEALSVRFSRVQEMNWGWMTQADNLKRYSTMHAISLRAMLELAGTQGFDSLAILDHDLVFKTDFVGWAMGTKADLVGCYLGNRKDPLRLPTVIGPLIFAPKFSVWHLLMSARFYQRIMEDVGLIFPQIENGWFHDTFSRVVDRNKTDWNMPMREMTEAEIGVMVEHVWSMSFNFGQVSWGFDGYSEKLARCEEAFDKRFPNGIRHLFAKVGL